MILPIVYQFDGTPYFVMKTGTSPDIMLQEVVDYDAIVASGKIPTFLIRVTVQVISLENQNEQYYIKKEKACAIVR